MRPLTSYSPAQFTLLLAPFVFSFAFGLDIYIPIIPQMTELFETTPALVQLTLSLFLLTTGAGQLFIGPLADQFGRRAIFYAASTCFALGALGCAFSGNIACLILFRVISALGACGMLVSSFATVRDLYSGDESAKMFGFLNGAIGISPTFAPIIGGYLSVYCGWQSLFFFLAAIGLLGLLITRWKLQDTLAPEARTPINRDILKRYWRIITHRQFLVYATIAGLAEGVFFCFFSVSPFIIINLLGVPTQEFGYYFAVFGAVIAFGGIGSGKVVERFGIELTTRVGISLILFGGITMLTWYGLASLSLSGFLVPMVIACTGAMFLVGAGAAAALDPFGAIAGTAAAAFGAVEFGLSAAVGSLLMLFPVASTIPYGIAIVLLGLLSLGFFQARPILETSNVLSWDE